MAARGLLSRTTAVPSPGANDTTSAGKVVPAAGSVFGFAANVTGTAKISVATHIHTNIKPARFMSFSFTSPSTTFFCAASTPCHQQGDEQSSR
jgi:hypothetical protein